MVTSCISHCALEAADSGFLWLFVGHWERGTNRRRASQRGRETAGAGLLPALSGLGSGPKPVEVQPDAVDEIHQPAQGENIYILF